MLEPVDGTDVWVIERGEHTGFALETREPFAVVTEYWRQHLDRDVASQLRVVRSEHVAHPARSESEVDAIGADLLPGKIAGCTYPGQRRFRDDG
jgi:hypothetical protein